MRPENYAYISARVALPSSSAAHNAVEQRRRRVPQHRFFFRSGLHDNRNSFCLTLSPPHHQGERPEVDRSELFFCFFQTLNPEPREHTHPRTPHAAEQCIITFLLSSSLDFSNAVAALLISLSSLGFMRFKRRMACSLASSDDGGDGGRAEGGETSAGTALDVVLLLALPLRPLAPAAADIV